MDKTDAELEIGPQRGRTMDGVRARYGKPESRKAAVGNPPITRWYYPDFTVYFEYKHVVHSVDTR